MTRIAPFNSPMAIRKPLFRWIGWFATINAGVLIIAMVRYFQFAGDIQGIWAHIYTVALLVGHPFFLAFTFTLVILLPIATVFPKKWFLFSAGVVLATTGIAMLTLDYVVYSQFRVHLNKVMFDLVIGGGKEIFDFSWKNYALALAFIAGVLLCEIIATWLAWRRVVRSKKSAVLGGLLFCIAIIGITAAHGIHAWADASYYRPITSLSRHLPLYYPLTAKRFLQKKGWVDLAENRVESRLKIEPTTTRNLAYPMTKLSFSAKTNHLNLLIIVIDSWRFDALNSKVTPNIHRFISQRPVWQFTQHLSGGNGTRIGIFSLFYGLSGVHWETMTSEQVGPVLIRTLKDLNYAIGIFASAKLTTPPFDRNVFIDINNLRSFSQGNTAWERDQSALQDWSRWLKERKPGEPFFSFIFLDAAHTYSIPPDYPTVFTPMWKDVNYLALNKDLDPLPFYNRYKTSIHYIDSLTNRIFSALDRHGLIEDTIIVITGDHGQEFNDTKKNFWGHGGNYTDYQIKVPLVICWPEKEPKKITHQTSHLDVVPTLMMDFLGCVNPISDYSDGYHLLDTSGREWLVVGGYFNYAIREKGRITMAYSNGNYEIFDLNHQLITDARLNYDVVAQAMRQASRFYRN